MVKRISIKINITVRALWIWPLTDYVKYLIGFLGRLLEILHTYLILSCPWGSFLERKTGHVFPSPKVFICLSKIGFKCSFVYICSCGFSSDVQYMLDLCKISSNFQVFENVISEFCIFLIFRSIFHYLRMQLVKHLWFSFLFTHLPFPDFHINM